MRIPPPIGDLIFDKVTDFTLAYHSALEAEMDARGRKNFPDHGDRTGIVTTIKASDAIATFYLPSQPDPEVKDDHYKFDLSGYDLNTICQSTSVQRLKVAAPRIGEPWDRFPLVPPDTEPIPNFSVPWIHDDIRKAAIAGNLEALQGMVISPVVQVEQGICKRVRPGRTSIWSPVFDVPGIGTRRLYLWTHAEFWWLPEKIDFDPAAASDVAKDDVIALQTVLDSVPTLTEKVAEHDLPTLAAKTILERCDAFAALLDEHGDKEEKLHQWLARPENRLFLDSDAVQVRSKVRFGNYVSDFVVRRSDGTYKLIEIEPAAVRIFTKSRSEPSAHFNRACQQVRDWQRYIREQVHEARDWRDLPGIYEPMGMVLMGRSADIEGDQALARWLDLKTSSPIEPMTYDEACNRVRALAAHLEGLMRSVD